MVLDKEGQGALEQIARGRSLPARLVERARIVLRAAAGLQDQQIASELGITPEKVARWRNRYLDGGISALEKDASRPGRPRNRLCHGRSEDGYVQTGLCWHHFGLCHKSMSPVETLLQLGDGRDYFVHAGYRAKDHARHGFIVPPQISEHSVVRSQSEAAGSS